MHISSNVCVLAETLVKSPRKLFIFIANKYAWDLSIFKRFYVILETKSRVTRHTGNGMVSHIHYRLDQRIQNTLQTVLTFQPGNAGNSTHRSHRHRERVGLDQARSHRGGTAVSASPCHAKVDVRIIRTRCRCSEWTPVNGIVNTPVKQQVNAQVEAPIDKRANEPENELWMRRMTAVYEEPAPWNEPLKALVNDPLNKPEKTNHWMQQ